MMPQPTPSLPMPDHESASRMTEDPAAAAGPAAMKVESVSVRPTENGGYVVTCSKRPATPSDKGPGYESKDYAFGSLQDTLAYLTKELGGGAPATEPDADEGAAL